jgi:hypothetical protein
MVRRIPSVLLCVITFGCQADRITQAPPPDAKPSAGVDGDVTAFAPGWAITTLPLPTGYSLGEATAITDGGEMFGWVRQTAASVARPARWSNGQVSLLTLPAGVSGAEVVAVSATGTRIMGNARYANNASAGVIIWQERSLPSWLKSTSALEVVGMSRNGQYWAGWLANFKGQHMIVGTGASFTKVIFVGEESPAIGTGANDSKMAVGSIAAAPGTASLVVVNPSYTISPLLAPASSAIFRVNNAGTVGGTVSLGGVEYAATAVAPYTTASTKWQGRANGLSEKGRLVGIAGNQAKTWYAGTLTTLPVPFLGKSARALSANLCGRIVGSTVVAPTGARLPAVWVNRGALNLPVCD